MYIKTNSHFLELLILFELADRNKKEKLVQRVTFVDFICILLIDVNLMIANDRGKSFSFEPKAHSVFQWSKFHVYSTIYNHPNYDTNKLNLKIWKIVTKMSCSHTIHKRIQKTFPPKKISKYNYRSVCLQKISDWLLHAWCTCKDIQMREKTQHSKNIKNTWW